MTTIRFLLIGFALGATVPFFIGMILWATTEGAAPLPHWFWAVAAIFIAPTLIITAHHIAGLESPRASHDGPDEETRSESEPSQEVRAWP